VKLDGGGVNLGDMHALQGDGEIAGHTCDVSGTVTLQVEVLKGLGIDGPVLFPLEEDLPFLARPLSQEERRRALALGRRYGVAELEESLPISVIGTGPDLNSATDNGLARAAELLGMSIPEVKNRATISGAIEIGRHPGSSR
jgi:acetamidase/formamidase